MDGGGLMVEEGGWLVVHDGERVLHGDAGFLLMAGDGISSWPE